MLKLVFALVFILAANTSQAAISIEQPYSISYANGKLYLTNNGPGNVSFELLITGRNFKADSFCKIGWWTKGKRQRAIAITPKRIGEPIDFSISVTRIEVMSEAEAKRRAEEAEAKLKSQGLMRRPVQSVPIDPATVSYGSCESD